MKLSWLEQLREQLNKPRRSAESFLHLYSVERDVAIGTSSLSMGLKP